jgi:hypothetical protein
MREDKRGCDLINAFHGNATDRTECEKRNKDRETDGQTDRQRNRGAERDIQGDSIEGK